VINTNYVIKPNFDLSRGDGEVEGGEGRGEGEWKGKLKV